MICSPDLITGQLCDPGRLLPSPGLGFSSVKQAPPPFILLCLETREADKAVLTDTRPQSFRSTYNALTRAWGCHMHLFFPFNYSSEHPKVVK